MKEENDASESAPGKMSAALDRTRNDLGARLSGLIESAFRRYEIFAGDNPPDGVKAFAAHAAACRAALAHLEQLFKLAQWAGGDKAMAATPFNDVDRLIADAEEALEKAAADT